MKRFISIIIIIICFGCQSSGKPPKPDNLISKDKMVDILYDVFVLNAAKGTNKSVLENSGINPENYVFEKYNIDSLQFATSTEYYGFYIEDYQAILGRVKKKIDNEKKRSSELVEKEEKEKIRRRDSIKKLSDSLGGIKRIRKIEQKKD